ncbi:MAG: RNA polymerase sigma factor [Gemmatimonadaceae bacterium]|nr:RNA polymerase sigma factor [Gemmatimonadaceae bacterium]
MSQPHGLDFATHALPYLDDVTRFARSLVRARGDADDLVQETFLNAFRGWHSYDGVSDLRGWLFVVCRHTWYRLGRREERYVAVEDDGIESLAAARLAGTAMSDGRAAMWAASDLGPAIADAIEALPDVFRSVVLLVDVQDLGYDEAAQALGIPIGTVRSRLFRARRLLQERLLDHARDLGVTTRETTG